MGTTEDIPSAPEKPWMQAFGGLRDLHGETLRVEILIEQGFERVDEEDCGEFRSVTEADAFGGSGEPARQV